MSAGDLAHTEAPGLSLRLRSADEGGLRETLEALVSDNVAGGIARRDATLWGTAAEDEAAKRLAWIDLPQASRDLLEPVLALRTELRAAGVDRVVLCGMGGSSLAPEVICGAEGLPLVVLDASDPDSVRAATGDALERTVVVVSSKSGGTVETDSQRRAFEQAFSDAGIDPAERIVVVTDPGSPLAEASAEAGYRTFLADPDVGGRYSALTAFGLVPSGLAGADLAGLLDGAAAVHDAVTADSPDNPALRLGGLLAHAARTGVDKLILASAGASYAGLGDWIEQLVAESTGKEGRGVLPVVVEGIDAPGLQPSTGDAVLVTYGPDPVIDRLTPASGWGAAIDGTLGAQMLTWEVATAVAGRVLGINPFDQPDVESAKQAARALLDETPEEEPALLAADGLEVRALGAGLDGALHDADSIDAAVSTLLDRLSAERDRGYLAVMAYAERAAYPELAACRRVLAERTGRPVTFGWGPRFLHSTGQLHKGGPPVGVFLQVTVAPRADLPIPGRPFGFAQLVAAQAAGDARVLAAHDRPVLRLHLRDPSPEGPAYQRLLAALGVTP